MVCSALISMATPNKFRFIISFDSRPAQAAKGMLAFGIFITHGLAGYVAIDITWTEYVCDSIKNHRHKTILHYVVRTSVVLVTCKSQLAKLRSAREITYSHLDSPPCCRHSKFGAVHFAIWRLLFVFIGPRVSGNH